MEYEVPWTTKAPDGAEVEIHLWADRGRGDAEVRVRDGLILGTIGDVRQSEPPLEPAPDAVARYGAEWVNHQLDSGRRVFSFRMARI